MMRVPELTFQGAADLTMWGAPPGRHRSRASHSAICILKSAILVSSMVRDLLIICAGPSGLAVAIAASDAQLDYEIVEKGVLVNSIFNFPPGMTFFTTPDLLEIGKLPFVTPYEKPTRHEALRYYRRVVDAYRMNIVFGEEALTIEKALVGGESVFIVNCQSDRGVRRE